MARKYFWLIRGILNIMLKLNIFINTHLRFSWSGGAYGEGKRMSLAVSFCLLCPITIIFNMSKSTCCRSQERVSMLFTVVILIMLNSASTSILDLR